MDRSNVRPKNISIILPSDSIIEKYAEEVKNLSDSADVNIELVLIDRGGDSEKTSHSFSSLPIEFLRRGMEQGPKTITHAEPIFAERFLGQNTPRKQRLSLLSKIPINELEPLANAKHIRFTPIKTGEYTYEIPDELVDAVTEKTDVVILLGFTKILRGRILYEPEFGVLSFHPSDIRRYRGRPGSYWQFLNDEPETGLTLQQLTPALDGGRIVVCRHTDISDAKTWWDVKLRVRKLYGDILEEAINKLRDEDFDPIELSEDELGTLTYETSRDKWKNELRMTLKNIRGRYFGWL